MDNFNKVISFILGLVVVVVFIIVFAGKINYKGKPLYLFGKPTGGILSQLTKSTITPSPTVKPGDNKIIKTIEIKNQPQPTTVKNSTYGSYQTTTKGGLPNQPKTIPSTGSATVLLPLFASGFFIGIFIKKRV